MDVGTHSRQSRFPRLNMFARCGGLKTVFPGLMAALFLGVASAQAQTYSITSFAIGGGDGTSNGTVFSLSGVIGQAEASAAMTSGHFSLTGGFWSPMAVVPDGEAPPLTITYDPQSFAITVSWPGPATGWFLQQTSDLAAANWVSTSESVSDDGTRRFIDVTPSAAQRFYRLHR